LGWWDDRLFFFYQGGHRATITALDRAHSALTPSRSRDWGFETYLDSDFLNGPRAREKPFDSLRCSNVFEHMDRARDRNGHRWLSLFRTRGRVRCIRRCARCVAKRRARR
jgi:hypothetical protein